jgi:hypothetical protein
MTDVVVLGQVGRDLVLRLAALPEAGGSAQATARHELLGGKGANQAVALAQLGVPVALVGVLGDDRAGAEVRAQALADGIDVSGVVTRPGAATALLVDLVEDGGRRRLVEDVPREVLLTPADVEAATDPLGGCQVLVVQLQQPGEAVCAALEQVPDTAFVVADGAPGDEATRAAVLSKQLGCLPWPRSTGCSKRAKSGRSGSPAVSRSARRAPSPSSPAWTPGCRCSACSAWTSATRTSSATPAASSPTTPSGR